MHVQHGRRAAADAHRGTHSIRDFMTTMMMIILAVTMLFAPRHVDASSSQAMVSRTKAVERCAPKSSYKYTCQI